MQRIARRAVACLIVAVIPLLLGCASARPRANLMIPPDASARLGLTEGMVGSGVLVGSGPVQMDPEDWGVGETGWQVSAAGGFSASPGGLLMAGEALYRIQADVSTDEIRGHLSVGPLLQLGFSGNHFLLGPSGNVRYTFDVPYRPRLKPFAEGGLGILISSRKDHATYGSGLLLLGGGVDYMIQPNVGVGGRSYLNIAPGPGEDFFISFLGGASFYF